MNVFDRAEAAIEKRVGPAIDWVGDHGLLVLTVMFAGAGVVVLVGWAT